MPPDPLSKERLRRSLVRIINWSHPPVKNPGYGPAECVWLEAVKLKFTYMLFANGHGATKWGILLFTGTESAACWEDSEFSFLRCLLFSAMIWAWKWRHHFFHQNCKKMARTFKWFLEFDWLLITDDSLILTVLWFILAGFSPPNPPL